MPTPFLWASRGQDSIETGSVAEGNKISDVMKGGGDGLVEGVLSVVGAGDLGPEKLVCRNPTKEENLLQHRAFNDGKRN